MFLILEVDHNCLAVHTSYSLFEHKPDFQILRVALDH